MEIEKETTIEKKWKKEKTLKIVMLMLWIGAIALVIGTFLFFNYISKQDLPSFEDLENPEYDQASIIYDDNGTTFGKYYIENRVPVHYDQISPFIVDALLSTEDERFHSHSGIDVRALSRVAFKTVLLRQESSGGGSTISQQLAKLLFKRPSLRGMSKIKRSFELVKVKLKEWMTAVKIERSYTKEEIMAMYLNKFEFINGAHGIQAASQTYFSKEQENLNVDEAAILVGMLKNPSLYNPLRFPDKAKRRRNIVLSQMEKADKLDRVAYDSLIVKDVNMDEFQRKTQSEGPAPYFRAELTKWLRKLFKENDINKSDGTSYNIYTDGLKIFTTLDLRYQKHAEEAVTEHMKWNQERFDSVWKDKNPWKYEADASQRKIRNDIFERRIRASDRYISLRNKHLSANIAKLRDRYTETPFTDNAIKAMIRVESKKNGFRKEIKDNYIKSNYLDEYKSIMKMKDWTELKNNWQSFIAAYDKSFNTEVKMMVFDYSEEQEKEVKMTPLDSVRYHNMMLQSGLLSVDPKTGYIKAWVGGVNHQYFKYDHVNSQRQVGSTIKPFVYATAIGMMGISPCTTFDDIQYTIAPGDANFDLQDEWTPANANGKFTLNKYNLYHGLLYSKNSITVRLVKEMGTVQVVRELLRNVGINVDEEVTNNEIKVPNLPSISLGAVNLSLYEMTGAYTAFANNGMYTEPIFIKRIEDKSGNVIYNAIPDKKVAINPKYNAVMVDMLQNNVGGKYGLGIKTPVGGKTGTTNDYTDGWFMSITPNLVSGTWVGGDDRWIRFLSLDEGQGYVLARPIVQKYLKRLEDDEEINLNTNVNFPAPPYGFKEIVDCTKYKEITPEEEQAEIIENKKQLDEFEEEFGDDFEEELEDLPIDTISIPIDTTRNN
jgi:penicillin-binding protein 1A|tara:strand:+ start:1658 stop:4312 length:2655 start_codon:yes stop_codon:yes gene_type:complete